MGLFSFKDKAGPGVSKNEPKAPAYVRFFKVYFGHFSRMVWLNIVYLFACFPIFTIGPATAGMTYVMRNYSQGKHVETIHDFIKKCREHFKQGLAVFVIDAIAAVLLYFSISFWWHSNGSSTLQAIALVFLIYIAYLLVCTNLYIFPMMVSFDLPFRQLIRNSVILGATQFGKNILMILFDGVVIGVCLIFWPIPLPLMICCLFTFCALFNNIIVYPVLVKHVATPKDKSGNEIDEEDVVFRDNVK